MLRENFGINDYKKCMEILFLLAIAFLTFSYFGGYYLIITTIGKYSRLLERIAYVLFFCKILGTRYCKKEFFILLAVGIFAIITEQVSGNHRLLVTVLVVAAMKNIELKKIFKVSLYSLIFTVLLLGVCSLLGFGGPVELTQMYGREGVETRYSFGFIHPNQWAHAMFMILLFFVMAYEEIIDWKKLIFLFVANYMVYRLSVSKTAFAAGIILIVGVGVFRYAGRVLYVQVMKVIYLCGVFFAWWSPLLTLPKNEFSKFLVKSLNRMFTGRISIARNFYYYYQSSVFGMKIADVHPKTGEVLDMGYIRLLLENGWGWYCLLFVFLLVVVITAFKKQKGNWLVVITCILLYGMGEYVAFSQLPANTIFYLCGAVLFCGSEKDRKKMEKGLSEILRIISRSYD